jgi:hypothetical protein
MTVEVEKWHTVWKGRFVHVIPLEVLFQALCYENAGEIVS